MDKIIGKNIRSARLAQKMTQEELATKLQVAGCDMTRSTLAKIEAGIRHISLRELNAIKESLHLEYDALLSNSF